MGEVEGGGRLDGLQRHNSKARELSVVSGCTPKENDATPRNSLLSLLTKLLHIKVTLFLETLVNVRALFLRRILNSLVNAKKGYKY